MLVRSPAALRDWRARQLAQAEAAREETKTIQLERRRGLQGWSRGGIGTFHVTLVTEAGELRKAADELASGEPTEYITVRMSGGGAATSGANNAETIRQYIRDDGLISKSPTPGELEAVADGLDAMGIPRAAYDGKPRP